ncbi:hypothetical protein IF650_15430 [Cellulosimicrobium terreum]|nr:hypothetical protein [Cellulosimicrobium terreum]
MSTLDTATVLVVAPVLLVVVATLYVVEVWRRGRTDVVDRCWTLTFVAAIVTMFAYLAGGTAALWWATALGNGAFVLSLGAIWSGARARAGRGPLLTVVGASAAATASFALAAGQDGGPWAGGLAYLLGVAVWSLLAAVELLARSPRRAVEATGLGLACAVAGAYYAARAVAFAAGGPGSAVFERWFQTATTTVVNLVLIVVGAFAMMALRTRETTQAAAGRFDAGLGTRSMAHLDATVRDRAQRGLLGPSVRVVVVRLRDAGALRDAFGREGRERAREHVADVVLDLLPPAAAAGGDPARRDDVVVVLPEDMDPRAWARDVERAFLDRPLVLEGDAIVVDVSHAEAIGPADAVTDTARAVRGALDVAS